MVPAIAMTMWADERKTGTIELLLTLPVRLRDAVLGKFLAAWALMGIALALTFPIWITVNYLGDPDNGVIFAAYLGSWFMAGGFLAIGSCMSAATKNSVIAFHTHSYHLRDFCAAWLSFFIGHANRLGSPDYY